MVATSLGMEVVRGAAGARTERQMGWRSPPSEEEEEVAAVEVLKEQQWQLLNKPTCRTCC